MKRFFTLLFMTLLLTAALCVNASASSFDDAAKDLAAIGMLRGDASGSYALDRAPTRSEAAIMLVRLFGAEEEAKAAYAAGDLKHSFTDVSETASPYVAWLTVRGITNGTSATTFGSSNPCSSQMYAAFLLRALGYKDNTDFAYADAETFALTRGMVSLSFGDFRRDDLAAMTCQALGAELKDGSTYLLDSLIQSGAVDAAAAKPLTDKITALYRLQEASDAAMDGALDTDVHFKMGFSYGLSGQSVENDSAAVSVSGDGNVKVILDKEDIQMAMNLQMQMDGEKANAELWLKDGTMYVRADGESYKSTIPGLSEIYQAASVSKKTSAALLPFLKEVSVKTSRGDTVYTLAMNDALADFAKNLVPLILGTNEMDFSATMNGSGITYTFGQDGKLKTANVALKLTVSAGSGPKTASPLQITVNASMDMEMNVKASGKDVKITYPDFSGFAAANSDSIGVIGGADGPTSIFLTKAA